MRPFFSLNAHFTSTIDHRPPSYLGEALGKLLFSKTQKPHGGSLAVVLAFAICCGLVLEQTLVAKLMKN